MIWIVFLVAVVLLVTASTLLIANTIRLSIFARRREIEVMKLVGATNWFVRGPFMLEGLLCGLGGAVLAVILLVIGKEVALPSILPHIGGGSDVHAAAVRAERPLADRRRAAARGGRLRPHAPPLPPGLDGSGAPAAPGLVCSRGPDAAPPHPPRQPGSSSPGRSSSATGCRRRTARPTPVAMPSVVDEVRNALAARYYRPRAGQRAPARIGDEIISALKDPYTAYLAPPDYKLVRQETASSYTGIGVSVLPSRVRLRRRVDAARARAARRRARRRHDRAHRRR